MWQQVFDLLKAHMAEHGYLTVAVALLLENAGVPVPGESILLLASFLAYSQHQLSLPMIILTGVIAAMQFFTQAYTIGGATGNPDSSLLFYVTYIYTSAFQNFEMGYASAMSWLLFLVIVLCTALLLIFSRRWTYYER